MKRSEVKALCDCFEGSLVRCVGLEAEQGRIARRNARARALKILRAMRERLDRDYPPVKKEKASRRPRGSSHTIAMHRRRSLYDMEYMPLNDVWRDLGKQIDRLAKDCALVGVRLRSVADRKAKTPEIWVPTWAAMAKDVAEMRAAAKSKAKRDALRALYYIKVGAQRKAGG
jgi:hypothetical protein